VSLTLSAPAKINLSLEVLGKRNDGYHEVRMLMVGLSLSDTLGFKAAKELRLSCDLPGLDCGESNLVLRAARALQKATGCAEGAHISLKKRIPLGGGLAGGSTDAAATLKGLNSLWGCGLNTEALSKLGATLGSDIPFCLRSGWA
jgi:4-diphosphocytidyl-2-C-methyl-D-erythritol kinase